MNIQDYNPDALVDKKGLEIFGDMLKDDQVKAAMSVKKFARLSTQFFIKPASDSSEDKQIAEFYATQLEQMPGTMIRVLLGIMTALDYGYSILEENYQFIEEGQYNGKIGLASIKSRKPHDFDLEQDRHSNLIGLTQDQDGKEVALPIEKFLIMSWMAEWENPYGNSDLVAAYPAWWSKDVILKFWNIYIERYATPPLIGWYPPGATDKTKSDLLEILEDIQVKTAMRVPEGIRIEPLEVNLTGADIFSKAIESRDRMIAKSMLIPDLLGLSAVKTTGSYALGKKQFDLFIGILWHLGRTIEEVIHDQLTIPFIDMNFNVDKYPKWLFEPLTEESMETKAKIIQILSNAGFVDATNEETQAWVSRYMNILPVQTTQFQSRQAKEALSYKEPFKFYNPDGSDWFELSLEEDMARLEVLEDSFLTV